MNNCVPLHKHGYAPRISAYTYVELMLAMAITSILVIGLGSVVTQALNSSDTVTRKNSLQSDARFAMQQMINALHGSSQLLLPLKDNPATDWPEHIREQTVPASAPIGSSTLATAVLAVTLPHSIDLDGNGVADADNDGDGRFDEDLGDDANNDGMPGIAGIDDDGDGSIDEIDGLDFPERDDDEDGVRDEDVPDGLDDDADGSEGEDNRADMNGDSSSGLASVDDDGDGSIDEGHQHDDDEDGQQDEDPLDSVVFYLENEQLIERTPVPWDTNGDSLVSGADFIATPIASRVNRLRIERIAVSDENTILVDITLELMDSETGERFSLNSLVRLGADL